MTVEAFADDRKTLDIAMGELQREAEEAAQEAEETKAFEASFGQRSQDAVESYPNPKGKGVIRAVTGSLQAMFRQDGEKQKFE